MKKNQAKLVGRYVRLRTSAFLKVARQNGNAACLENLFVVAAIAHGINKLICYGGGYRVAVAPSDIVMV